MKIPLTFKEWQSDPSKAISYLLLFVVCALYWRSETQAKEINTRCENDYNDVNNNSNRCQKC